jgi:hypothetical protein
MKLLMRILVYGREGRSPPGIERLAKEAEMSRTEIAYELIDNDTGETLEGGGASMERSKELFQAGLKKVRYDRFDEVVFFEQIITKETTDAGIPMSHVERGDELERRAL